MGLIDLSGMFVAYLVAELRGNDDTRPWTRKAFVFGVLVETGLLTGLALTLEDYSASALEALVGVF